jgi:hypothetical protein
MGSQIRCESCGMPVESGPYCRHCVDAEGKLQSFDDRLERMVRWMMTESPELPRSEAEARTRAYMLTMPAWKDHPKLKG